MNCIVGSFIDDIIMALGGWSVEQEMDPEMMGYVDLFHNDIIFYLDEHYPEAELINYEPLLFYAQAVYGKHYRIVITPIIDGNEVKEIAVTFFINLADKISLEDIQEFNI